MNSRIKLLLTINILTLTILSCLFIKEKYPQRIYNRINSITKEKQDAKPHDFIENDSYLQQTAFFSLYDTSSKTIVMLGNSLVREIEWSELLNRTDVVNRGISNDITEGYLNRMRFVLNVNPKICFIEGGLNDLIFNIPIDTTLNNLKKIIEIFKNKQIRPILNSVTFVSINFPDATNFNKKIKTLNEGLFKIAVDNQIKIIDLNTIISEGNFRKKEYAAKDGMHLTNEAYLIWKNEILKILEQEKIN